MSLGLFVRPLMFNCQSIAIIFAFFWKIPKAWEEISNCQTGEGWQYDPETGGRSTGCSKVESSIINACDSLSSASLCNSWRPNTSSFSLNNPQIDSSTLTDEKNHSWLTVTQHKLFWLTEWMNSISNLKRDFPGECQHPQAVLLIGLHLWV